MHLRLSGSNRYVSGVSPTFFITAYHRRSNRVFTNIQSSVYKLQNIRLLERIVLLRYLTSAKRSKRQHYMPVSMLYYSATSFTKDKYTDVFCTFTLPSVEGHVRTLDVKQKLKRKFGVIVSCKWGRFWRINNMASMWLKRNCGS